jgi:ABC-2 type transport system permease protein
MQLIILPLAANYEVKNIQLAVVDNDHSSWSAKMVSRIASSGYFRMIANKSSYNEAMKLIGSDEADLILEIPAGFERNLVRENHQKVFIAVNAINGVKANLGGAYLNNILRTFNNDIRLELPVSYESLQVPQINIVSMNLYNPLLNYRLFMVPGILAILVTMVGGFLSALNIVKEKEAGTIEQINVTPIRKHHFILGKLIPFWVLGNIIFTIGLIVARVIYGITPAGNLFVMYGFISIYLLAVLGFGLLVSTICDTQQQAMFIMFFFMMIFILLGGLFTSIDSMPEWAKIVSKFNPVTYLISVMRMIILKGSGIRDILPHLGAVGLLALILNTWAVLNYKKTS